MVLGKVLAGEKGRETFLRTGGKKTTQQCLRLFFCLFVLGGGNFFFPYNIRNCLLLCNHAPCLPDCWSLGKHLFHCLTLEWLIFRSLTVDKADST